MRYVSTRGGGEPRRFCDILLEGLADDGAGKALLNPLVLLLTALATIWRRIGLEKVAAE